MSKKTSKFVDKKQKIMTLAGKRKTAIAKATIHEGNGKITINNKLLSSFNSFQQLSLREPLVLAEEILGDSLKSVRIEIIVHGGGSESQIEAARLALARALVAWFKDAGLKNKFLKYDRMLLVADTRRKEMRKPNDSKARAARQKSYR
jgi:small subunit ribosomal protein S9